MFSLLIVLIASSAHAELETPFAWDRCTTEFAGNPDQCVAHIASTCVAPDRDACLISHAKHWFAFGANLSIREPLTKKKPGLKLDLKSMSNSISKLGASKSECRAQDHECELSNTVHGVLDAHGPDASK